MNNLSITEPDLIAGLKSQSATSGTSLAWDGKKGLDFNLTLTGNVELNIYAIPYGMRGKLKVTQDSIGGRTLSFTNALLLSGVLNPAPNTSTYYEVIADGPNSIVVIKLG